jgi:hypothetical protein
MDSRTQGFALPPYSEAIPILQDLALGKDDFAAQAKHMLTKIGAQQK